MEKSDGLKFYGSYLVLKNLVYVRRKFTDA